MNAQLLLDAVGDIGDSYVMEFAQIKPRKTAGWGWLAAAAACLCLILFASLPYPREDRPVVEPTMPEGNVIWGSASGDIYVDICEIAEQGEIVFSPELTDAFAKSEDSTDIFAIRVYETTGASREKVYEEFIKPLGIYEEYLDIGVIFATQGQVREIAASDEFGFVFELAVKNDGGTEK